MRATGVRVVPPAVARRGSFIAQERGADALLREHRRLRRRRHHGRHLGHRRLLRADRQERAPVGRRRHRRRARAAAGQPDHHRGQLLHRRALRGGRRRDRRGELGDLAWACTSARAPRSTTARPARSATAACRPGSVVVSGNLPGHDGSYSLYCAVIVKQVDAGDARQDQHQRTAAGLSARGNQDHDMSAGNMEKVLRLMAEKKASDVYLSANTPILIKINGRSCNCPTRSAGAGRRSASCSPRCSRRAQIEELRGRPASSTSPSAMAGLGSFRCRPFRQRGTMAAVIRCIPLDIPTLDSLGLPPVLSSLVMEKRGLILMVGATGSGKSTTLASMLDCRNQQSSRPHPDHRGPDRIPVHATRSRSSTSARSATTRDRCSVALKNALRQAPDCILIGEIRDRETMTHRRSPTRCRATCAWPRCTPTTATTR